MIRQAQGLALCAALVAGIAGSAAAQGQIRTADHETLPVGTVLKAKLDQRLNSAEARVGDRFTATVLSDEDGSGLPRGTRVEGVVREAKAATEEKPGVLDVDFTALRFPDGTVRRVSGSLTSLDSKSVERTPSGRLVSKRTSKDQRMTFLGYGAGAGAVIGLLTGGNLLRSALLGAAGGFLYGQLQRDKEANGRYANVDLKEGAEFGVRLDERFTWVPATATLPGNRYGQRYGEPVGHSGQVPAGVPPRTNPADGAQANEIGVLVEDREVAFGAARPTYLGKVLMLPMSPVLRAAGHRFAYNAQTRQVTVWGVRGTVRTTVGSSIAVVAGKRVRLTSPARMIQGTLYVPAQLVELATGKRSEWDAESQTLLFYTPEAEAGTTGRDGEL